MLITLLRIKAGHIITSFWGTKHCSYEYVSIKGKHMNLHSREHCQPPSGILDGKWWHQTLLVETYVVTSTTKHNHMAFRVVGPATQIAIWIHYSSNKLWSN